jgi:hypothetical protein
MKSIFNQPKGKWLDELIKVVWNHNTAISRSTGFTPFKLLFVSHPVLEGKPNANHVRARISYSRTQQLHNMDIITQCSK